MDLVVLGNLIVDDIVYQDGSTRMGQAGGACLYMGLAAPLWGLRAGLVSVVGSDYPPEMLDALADHGVNLMGIRPISGPGLRTWLLYEGEARRVVHRLEGSTHSAASPTILDIPSDWRPRAVHLAPMPIDTQRALVTDLRDHFGNQIILSLDPFQPVSEETLSDWQSLVSEVDVLFLSEDELPSVVEGLDPILLLQKLSSKHLRALVYKQGSRGGLALLNQGAQQLDWPARAVEVRDTTGAGDAFAVGVLAALLQDQPMQRALECGVVSASLAIEGQGAEGLLEASSRQVRGRLERWFGK